MFKKILAATDILTVRDAPVLSAAKIASENGAQLLILHTLESAHSDNRNIVKDFRTWEDIENSPEYEQIVKETIEKLYSDVLLSEFYKIALNIKVVTGFPWEAILKCARESKPDLIVLGPHSKRAEEQGVVRVAGKIGSTVQKVISRENCPVMIINSEISSEMVRFKKILVGIDYSVSCESALSFAAKISKEYGSKILIFHMIPVLPYPKYTKENYESDLQNSNKRLREFCGRHLVGVDHDYQIWGGGAAHVEILKCAEQNSIDLIVMGSHTKSESGKWYAGSAVERVSYRSKCGIMVVTDPEVIEPWEEAMDRNLEAETKTDRLIHVFTTNKE
ncbi:MAG: universal stress protein [Desulfamplus sp.]|nr:universal stress protein [Desulfamplus sp.]MBF0412861.1 universal stress protein [Desulfamplus sp.]